MQTYSTGAKTEATLALCRRAPRQLRHYQQKTCHIFNVLLFRYVGTTFLRLSPHQEIIRRVVIGQHCACPPRLRPARCEQGDGLRRETLPFDQSGHFLRYVSRLLLFNRSTDEKKQIFRFRTGRPWPFDGVGVDHRKRSLHRFYNPPTSPELAPSSRSRPTDSP